jgi:hypothetical protein
MCYVTSCAGLSSFFVTGATKDVLEERNTFLSDAGQTACLRRFPCFFMGGSKMSPFMKTLTLLMCAIMADW